MDYNLATLFVVVVVEACKNLTTSLFLTYSVEVGCLTKIRGQLPRSQLRAPWGYSLLWAVRGGSPRKGLFLCLQYTKG